jgi:hypothetical protein
MKRYNFTVVVLANDLDRDSVVEQIQDCVQAQMMDQDCHVKAKAGPVKELTEQGRKVIRARVMKINAKTAGDAASLKKVVEEVEEATA